MAGKVVLNFSMSLDGFVAGPDIDKDCPMGVGGEALHDWMFASDADSADLARVAAIKARVGAVVLGRRTFDLGLPHWDGTPFPAPSFVVTHETLPPLPAGSHVFTFVDGVEPAVAQARAAAGTRDVIVMGADIARQCLAAGLVEEIELQIAPIFLGGGSRLFDDPRLALAGVNARNLNASRRVAHLTLALGKNADRSTSGEAS